MFATKMFETFCGNDAHPPMPHPTEAAARAYAAECTARKICDVHIIGDERKVLAIYREGADMATAANTTVIDASCEPVHEPRAIGAGI